MKKMTVGLVAALVGLGLATTACKVSDDQLKVISQTAGMFAAVGWIAIDNPNSNQLVAVRSVLDVIAEKASMVSTGATYAAVLYPEVVKVIDAKVEAQYRPICKAASITLLGQLDILFAAHPEWKSDQTKALSVVTSFVAGAKEGLALNETSPVMKQARTNFTARNAVLMTK